MEPDRLKRVLRQQVQTDQWFGVTALPVQLSRLLDTTTQPTATSTKPDDDAQAKATPLLSSPKAALTPSVPMTGSLPLLHQAGTTPMPSQLRSREDKLRLLTQMDEQEVKGCKKCGLCEARTQTVFGEGDPDTPLLFIGEGPGENEDLQGRPFVGRAGELLDKMIVAMGLKRESVYIANVVKCRPPSNRTPSPMEIDACWDYLRRQIILIHPKVIVTLGAPATKTLLQTTTGISMLRGQWQWFDRLMPQGPSFPVMPTYHPAYLLRAYTPENRRKVWDDLQKVMSVLKGQSPLPTR